MAGDIEIESVVVETVAEEESDEMVAGDRDMAELISVGVAESAEVAMCCEETLVTATEGDEDELSVQQLLTFSASVLAARDS